MNSPRLAWSNVADEQWATDFETLASSASIARPAEVDAWLVQVHDAVIGGGQRAADLFDSPQAAVADFVESLPIERRAAVDASGQTLADVIGSVVSALGLTAFALAIVHGVREGWQLDLSRVTLMVALSVLLGAVGIVSAWAFRATGRAAAMSVGGATLLWVAGSAAWVLWSGGGTSPVFTVPVWMPAAAGAALFVAGWNRPSPAPIVDDRSRSWTPAQWFTRLEGLLRGRHHLPAPMVASHLTEACELLEASGSRAPFEEFGAPETYALALVEGDSRSVAFHRRARCRLWASAAGILLAFGVADVATGTYNLGTAAFCVAGACCAWQALSTKGP